MSTSGPTASTAISAGGPRRMPDAPEGSAASGKTLGEIARLSPDAALRRLSSTALGLTPRQVKARLRSTGPNQVARPTRHTILRQLLGRSINPLNALLLALATASYFLGDQRAAIMIAVMVVPSISLGFIQEHRSNNAADKQRNRPLAEHDGLRAAKQHFRGCIEAERTKFVDHRRCVAGTVSEIF